MHLSANKMAKKSLVKEIEERIKTSQAIALAEYKGLSVAELKKLRIEAKKMGVEIKVFKNRLFKIAVENLKIQGLDDFLVGQNLFAFSKNDDMSAAKLLSKFAKENKILVIKAGTYEGKTVDAKGIEAIAALPTYEEALTILARSMMAPLQQLSISLNLYSEKEK